jgi:hypothetical protein
VKIDRFEDIKKSQIYVALDQGYVSQEKFDELCTPNKDSPQEFKGSSKLKERK